MSPPKYLEVLYRVVTILFLSQPDDLCAIGERADIEDIYLESYPSN